MMGKPQNRLPYFVVWATNRMIHWPFGGLRQMDKADE